jgi:hypothetical protein
VLAILRIDHTFNVVNAPRQDLTNSEKDKPGPVLMVGRINKSV